MRTFKLSDAPPVRLKDALLLMNISDRFWEIDVMNSKEKEPLHLVNRTITEEERRSVDSEQ